MPERAEPADTPITLQPVADLIDRILPSQAPSPSPSFYAQLQEIFSLSFMRHCDSHKDFAGQLADLVLQQLPSIQTRNIAYAHAVIEQLSSACRDYRDLRVKIADAVAGHLQKPMLQEVARQLNDMLAPQPTPLFERFYPSLHQIFSPPLIEYCRADVFFADSLNSLVLPHLAELAEKRTLFAYAMVKQLFRASAPYAAQKAEIAVAAIADLLPRWVQEDAAGASEFLDWLIAEDQLNAPPDIFDNLQGRLDDDQVLMVSAPLGPKTETNKLRMFALTRGSGSRRGQCMIYKDIKAAPVADYLASHDSWGAEREPVPRRDQSFIEEARLLLKASPDALPTFRAAAREKLLPPERNDAITGPTRSAPPVVELTAAALAA